MTRYKSGGVLGTENEGLNGVAGRVCGLLLVPPMKVSPDFVFGEVSGGPMAAWLGMGSFRGVCGRDRSYDS